MDPANKFQVASCAYALSHTVLNPGSTRPDTIFPGGKNYEMTQIFLDRIQNRLETTNYLNTDNTAPLLSEYFSLHFPSIQIPSGRKFPVEVLWAAYGIKDKTSRSPWALFYTQSKQS